MREVRTSEISATLDFGKFVNKDCENYFKCILEFVVIW